MAIMLLSVAKSNRIRQNRSPLFGSTINVGAIAGLALRITPASLVITLHQLV